MMDLLLAVLLISVLVKTTCLANKCAANYTEQGKACMVKVNEHFSLSVPLIMIHDKAALLILCKEYQEFFYCLHDVMDPCEEMGGHYFNVLEGEMEQTVGKHCPEVDPNRRRDKAPSIDSLTSISERCRYSASLLLYVCLSWTFMLIPGT